MVPAPVGVKVCIVGPVWPLHIVVVVVVGVVVVGLGCRKGTKWLSEVVVPCLRVLI